MKKISAIVVALVLFASLPTSFAEVHFKDLGFADAMKQAKKEKKIIMVDYYTTWCGWCKRLDRDTYSSDELGKYADENIVSLKLNAEAGEGIALAKSSGISGYPTIIFYNSDGKEIHRVVGYKPAPGFIQEMMKAVDKNTKS
ncbi:MAG: thioredoxin fold domain-containing protein [Ignavibacteriota bacterium]